MGLVDMSWRLLPKASWRRTTVTNTVFATLMSIVLISLLIGSVTVTGSMERSFILYHSTCGASGRLNLGLHLIINVISTCIIASSNYFMQVLSSPTRQEVDDAHRQHHSLDIGVPSLRNLRNVSMLKAVFWLLFVLSSVPIHMLFNSAVFMTDYQGAGFFMAIATEDFLNGHEYGALGTSLIHAGAPGFSDVVYPDDAWTPPLYGHWGLPVVQRQLLNRSSGTAQNLSYLSESARSWTRMDAYDCRMQYGSCTPRRDYGSVVLVADPLFQQDPRANTSKPAGFIVEDIFNLTEAGVFWNPQNYSTDEIRTYWNQFGSVDRPNPLWFSASCTTRTDIGADSPCYHNCATSLGLQTEGIVTKKYLEHAVSKTDMSWDIPLAFYDSLPKPDDEIWSVTTIEHRPTFNMVNIKPEAALSVTHCYAQPLQATCKVVLSNTVLIAVTLAVMIKAVLALLVCVLVRGNPLVTLGDAIESFIICPDPTTEGRAAVSLPRTPEELRRIWLDPPVMREWQSKSRPRIAEGIPRSTWFRTYALILAVLMGTAILLSLAVGDTPIGEDTGAFSHDQNQANSLVGQETFKDMSLVGKVLVANIPQLALTLCYFAYNALFTRACTEMEWNSYAISFKPLRVSYPAEGQVSTYRLQLPYSYSIPLLAVSTLLHWLVSNTIFVSVIDGDYLTVTKTVLPGISDSAYLALGFSSRAILIVFLLGLVLALVPWAFYLRLKATMIICGNNSFTISAACHVSVENTGKHSTVRDVSIEVQPLETSSDIDLSNDPIAAEQESKTNETGVSGTQPMTEYETRLAEALLRVSRSHLRWGVVPMSQGWYSRFRDERPEVEHLGFGTRDQDVKDPREGRYYA